MYLFFIFLKRFIYYKSVKTKTKNQNSLDTLRLFFTLKLIFLSHIGPIQCT